MRTTLLIAATLGLLLAASPAQADSASYFIWDDYGGSFVDAEKSTDPDDDLMCWAASASNVLWYTGWGWAGGMTSPDTMFAYFQDHWTDQGGSPYYGWDWWFDGTNDKQGAADAAAGWAQEDVDGGGGFYPALDINDYAHWDFAHATMMSSYETFLRSGYGTTISIGGNIAHSITGWGFNYDTTSGDLLGLWVSDSDDDKGGAAPRPNTLRYYGVVYEDRGDGSHWYMNNYGTNNYVTEVISLEIKPGFDPVPIPEPSTLALLGLGGLGLLWLRRRRKAD